MKFNLPALLVFLFCFAGFLPIAEAHSLDGASAGLASGFSHPFLGVDHLLAMIAVGIWAWQLGGRAVWLLPISFAGMMAIAAGFGVTGFHLPLMEPGIACSLLIMGLLIAGFVRLPTALGSLLVGLFALFHGYAHGIDLPSAASPVLFGIGFTMASGLLHGLGILFAKCSSRHQIVQRMAGYALIAGSGLLLTMA